MTTNQLIGMLAALANTLAVLSFALSMLLGTLMGSYLSSILIAYSFVIMMGAYALFAKPEKKLAGMMAVGFAIMYATIISLVYFAQMTTVRSGGLTEQAASLLDYQQFGLSFNYDMLGYALMALATFFAGLSFCAAARKDKWLKALLLIHGVFSIACFIMPVLALFTPDMAGSKWIGTAILECWCVYFIPIGILSFLHFHNLDHSGQEITPEASGHHKKHPVAANMNEEGTKGGLNHML